MKKMIQSLPFAALTAGGAFLFLATVFGAFENFGIGTEIAMLSIGFLSMILGSYATLKTLTEN